VNSISRRIYRNILEFQSSACLYYITDGVYHISFRAPLLSSEVLLAPGASYSDCNCNRCELMADMSEIMEQVKRWPK